MIDMATNSNERSDNSLFYFHIRTIGGLARNVIDRVGNGKYGSEKCMVSADNQKKEEGPLITSRS